MHYYEFEHRPILYSINIKIVLCYAYHMGKYKELHQISFNVFLFPVKNIIETH